MAGNVICHRAPVVIYGSIRMLIFDALTARTTICEVLMVHAGRSFLRGESGILGGWLRSARPTHATKVEACGEPDQAAGLGGRRRLYSAMFFLAPVDISRKSVTGIAGITSEALAGNEKPSSRESSAWSSANCIVQSVMVLPSMNMRTQRQVRPMPYNTSRGRRSPRSRSMRFLQAAA